MSKSRLEKFLYALYSLDSSDLPSPLSRIEELYKCLVTGDEAPTFEPLSRVEKYLMAILGGYDVELLPSPLSRVEVLLYKLATGDDNLDDVKSFLSEHEELLAEIIRNGSSGGNIDIEYVLYTLSTGYNTLYNTAKKPVKSAILSGQTLVNLHKLENYSVFGVVLDGGINQHFGNNTSYATWRMFDISMLKPNTEYGVFCWVLENTLSETYWECHVYNSSDSVFNPISGLRFNAGETGMRFGKLTTISNFTDKTCGLRHVININTPSTEYVKFRCVLMEYQDGMENWDIPYFEGMQSVKMPVLTATGKNLFDMKDIDKDDFEPNKYQTAYYGKEFILEPNTKYTIKAYLREDITDTSVWTVFNITNNNSILEVINIDKTGVSGTNEIKQVTFTTDSTGKVGYSIYSHNQSERSWLGSLPFDIQLEKGPTATSYEPHKSNILTTSEDITLGSVGGVYDTLDLSTGNIISRTELYTYKGENEPYFNNSIRGYVVNVMANANVTLVSGIISDKFINRTFTNYDTGVYGNNNGAFYFFDKLVTSAQEFKEKHIGANFRYRLLEESVKTVDLSVVNQDGNNTKLSTFNDITHVTLSSEGLIPEAELEVATKNEEVLNTMSLEMDDIFTTQTTLGEAVNTQSENVDATMIATTEIYEDLL